MAGAIVADEQVRSSLWALDSIGLIIATSLLALKYFRLGSDFVASGFMVFAIGEAVMLSGTAADLRGSIPAFAAGTACWSAALCLVSGPAQFPILVRIIGVIAAILFAITSGTIYSGHALSPISTPLPSFAYPFLVLTFAGWIWTLMRESRPAS
jgi:hypothetical protein